METTTTNETQEVVFQPDSRVALGQKLMFAFIGVVLATGVNYFKRDDGFLKSAAIGLAIGVGVFIFLAIRSRMNGSAKLILGQDTLTIEDKKNRTVLPLNEVSKAVHYAHGENRWEFHLQDRREPVRYALYGFLNPELNAIKQALLTRIRCEEERTPMEGPRPITT